MLVQLGIADDALLHEIGHQLQILDILAHGVVILDPSLDDGYLAQLLARGGGVVPELRRLGLLLLVLEVDPLLFDIQATLQRPATLGQLLDLFVDNHKSIFKSSLRAAKRRIRSAADSTPNAEVLTHRS